MLLIATLLFFTLLIVPYLTFYYGTPLTELQYTLLVESATLMGIFAAACFVLGELSRNNSQVDKLWSVVPIIYTWYITIGGGWTPRMVLMSVLVTLWGSRLTYNFARRGGYSWKFWTGSEDYRWEILRQKPGFQNRFVWLLFNLLFICGYQMTLIYLFSLPILTCLSEGATAIGWLDGVLASVFIGLVYIEWRADREQYVFQTEKHRRINAGEPLEKYAHGFVRSGLWSVVRHPNYAAEQAIWVVFYLFSIVATGEWINWSIAGCLLLLILFKSSSDFSESISATKYPEYKHYQATVPRFWPLPGQRAKANAQSSS